jgi:hypothetical protein
MPINKPNYKTVHCHGKIELYINEQLKKTICYSSPEERKREIKKMEHFYPINKNQLRYIHIVPKWDLWNGFIGDIEYDEDIVEMEIENYERNSKYLRKLA